jgi:predicted nucleotidyltransferase component of viral defense system
MAGLDFISLYALQDRVLDCVFSVDTGFYLTGGTCLHRFYFPERHSVDLDLFSNDNTLYRDDVRRIVHTLNECGISSELIVDSRDFVRLMINGELQVDLVNDRVYRSGRSVRMETAIVVDNLQNLAANKICAVLGRDDPKDVFDLYVMHRHQAVQWPLALEDAAKKCAFDPETLMFRLNAFPLQLLDDLHVVNPSLVSQMKQHYHALTHAILA